MKNRFYALLTPIVGVFLIVLGIVQFSEDEVTCGSRTMSAGDTCVTSSRKSRSSTERSFEEQRDANSRTGWIMLGFGSLALIGGVFWSYSEFRKKRPAGFRPQGPHAPHPPYPHGAQPPVPAYPQQPYRQAYQPQSYQQQPVNPGTYPPGPAPGYPQRPYQQQPFPPQH